MTGYRGRVGLYEILMLSPDMKQAVSEQNDIAKIRDLAYRMGMKPLRISGAMKVAAGITTLAEVFKVVPAFRAHRTLRLRDRQSPRLQPAHPWASGQP